MRRRPVFLGAYPGLRLEHMVCQPWSVQPGSFLRFLSIKEDSVRSCAGMMLASQIVTYITLVTVLVWRAIR
jgi:hypothetical protein